LPPIFNRHLGQLSVNGLILDPIPAARMIVFIIGSD